MSTIPPFTPVSLPVSWGLCIYPHTPKLDLFKHLQGYLIQLLFKIFAPQHLFFSSFPSSVYLSIGWLSYPQLPQHPRPHANYTQATGAYNCNVMDPRGSCRLHTCYARGSSLTFSFQKILGCPIPLIHMEFFCNISQITKITRINTIAIKIRRNAHYPLHHPFEARQYPSIEFCSHGNWAVFILSRIILYILSCCTHARNTHAML